MAYCPHCDDDRPIKRQRLAGACYHCGARSATFNEDTEVWHKPGCRGPVTNCLDVCTYCDTAVFAGARTRDKYESYARSEREQKDGREAKEMAASAQLAAEEAATRSLEILRLVVCCLVMPLAGIALAWFKHDGFWNVLNALVAYAVVYILAFFPVWFAFEYFIAKRQKTIPGAPHT